MEYIITWKSGGESAENIYLSHSHNAKWAAVYNRQDAAIFSSRKAAADAWLGMHRHPECYEYCLRDGSVRIESMNEPEIFTT